MHMKYFFLGISLALSLLCTQKVAADSDIEQRCLRNVRQLTFASMGFEKAGEAYFSPDGTEIIFQAVPEGESHYQMYTMRLDVGIPHLVSTGKGACTCGYYRPDGKKILFASSHANHDILESSSTPLPTSGKYTWDLTPYMNIYEADPDGTNLTALTSGPAYHAECSYSPDGTKILFASNADGSMNLYIMNADGTNVEQLTHTHECYNGGPFFSPDGSKIIYRADPVKRHYLQLFMMHVDGTENTQLTFNDVVNWAPYWHPNGKVIAYTTSLHGHANYQIYLLNVDTGVQYRLTHSLTFEGLPSFSHDGKKILWTSKRVDNTCQIFMADFEIPPEL